MTFNYSGKDYEFRGEYASPSYGQYFLSDWESGAVIRAYATGPVGVFAIVHLVPTQPDLKRMSGKEQGAMRHFLISQGIVAVTSVVTTASIVWTLRFMGVF